MKSHSMSSDYERRFLQERSWFWTSYLWFFLRYHAFGSGGFEGCVWLLLASPHQFHGETSKAEGSDDDSHCQLQDLGRRCHAEFAPGIFWGSLLLQCGDVELNPGPMHKDSMRQTRLTSGCSAGTTERTDGSQNTPSKAAASTKEPTLSDVMTTP